MSLNRREMLRLGAMGAAGAILTTASSSVLGQVTLPSQAGATPLPQTPLVPQVQPLLAPGGINPQLFAKAKAALDQHKIAARDWIGIVDFNKASHEERFHVVDLRSGEVESVRVARGRSLVYTDADHVAEFDREGLEALFTEAGLEVVDSEFRWGVMRYWVRPAR